MKSILRNLAFLITPADGCKLGINNLKDGIVTRGVVIDIPRLRNLPYLENGTHVYREDIEAWEKQAGVKVAPGDALLLRTGRWAKRPQPGRGGYDASFLPFLKDRDVAIMGGDSAQDVGVIPGCTNKRWEFLLMAAPIRVPGGTGSPINPVAVF